MVTPMKPLKLPAHFDIEPELREQFSNRPGHQRFPCVLWQQPKGLVTGQVVRTARASLVSGDYNTLQLQLYPRNEQDMRQGPAAPCLLVS